MPLSGDMGTHLSPLYKQGRVCAMPLIEFCAWQEPETQKACQLQPELDECS